MTAFKKFDPHAFLERERLAPDSTVALAALATLAGQPLENEIRGTASKVLLQCDTGAVTANSIEIQRDDQTLFHGLGKNQNLTPTPAKVAKAAKVEPSVVAPDDTPWGETEEERAAIIQYDGGATRTWAEALTRLDPAYPPCDIPPIRWLRFIDDCGRFLDDGWAACAEGLGWGPLDLFGCDRTKPFARINRAGLLWLLNGRRLLALAADTAAIATASGGYLTFQRRFREPGGVLAWELPLNAA
jgi:hypothetical protein